MRLKELCRAFDQKSVEILGGFATSPKVEPHIKLEAIKMLFDRGHGRPKGEKKHKHKGTVNLVMRHVHEGKPKGEK